MKENETPAAFYVYNTDGTLKVTGGIMFKVREGYSEVALKVSHPGDSVHKDLIDALDLRAGYDVVSRKHPYIKLNMDSDMVPFAAVASALDAIAEQFRAEDEQRAIPIKPSGIKS